MSHGKKSKRKKHQKQADLKHTEADKHLNKRPPHVDITGRVEANFPPDLVKRYDTAGEKEEGWNRKIFAAEIIAAILLAASVGAVAWQGYLLRESNRINRESLQSVQRAFVTFREMRGSGHYEFINGKNAPFYTFTPWFENSGNTPAIDIVNSLNADWKMLPNVELDERKFKGLIDKSKMAIATLGPKNMLPFGYSEVEEKMIFGDEFTTLMKKHPPMTTMPCLWGWMAYHDVLAGTKAHVTEFCVKITGFTTSVENGKAGVRFINSTCREHNCTDETCPDYSEIVDLFTQAK
jgi:hypothetical protein